MRPLDPDLFRHVLGHFCTGVTIVTSVDNGEPVGFTSQSFASLSLDPPLVTFAVARTSKSWPRIQATGKFCANVLAHDQEELSRQFSVSGADKFAGVDFTLSPAGCPVLGSVLAWIDALTVGVHEGGDHSIIVGEVTDLAINRDTDPLLFYQGGYGRFSR